MLEPEMILATGESVSSVALVGFLRPSCCSRGDCPRLLTAFAGLLLRGSTRGSSGGGADRGVVGNLKLCENELEGFRVVGGMGVTGVVVMSGRLRGERGGKTKSVGAGCDNWGEAADSGEGCVAERWPGEATGYELGRPGTTCRLADRAWPRGGRRMGMPPRSWWLSAGGFALFACLVAVACAPSEIMDSDLPWRCPLALLLPTAPDVRGGRRSPTVDGLCSESAGPPWRLWAILGGACAETNDELRDMVGLVDECTGGSLRCRSCRSPPLAATAAPAPPAKPLCCLRDGRHGSPPSMDATFRKVMVHSMSSPANTVESFHCTNTRMFEADMVDPEGGEGDEDCEGGKGGAGCCNVGCSSWASAVKYHGGDGGCFRVQYEHWHRTW